MLNLGRAVLFVVAVVAGLGLLVWTLPWLAWRQDGTPVPAGIGVRWLAAALVLGVALLARHGLGRLQRAREAAELAAVQRGRAFEAHGSVRWFLLMVPMALLFAWVVYAAAQKGAWGVAALTLFPALLFAFLAWQVALQVLRPGPMLRMDDRAIAPALYGPIPWGEVVGIELQSIQVRHTTQHTLMLGVRGAARYLDNAPPLMRWLHRRRLRDARGMAALPVPLNLLDKDAGLIHQSALSLRQRHDDPFLEHWHHRMDEQEVRSLLRMHELVRDSERVGAEMRALPGDADPARLAALDARLRDHLARHDAALPELKAALGKHAQRTRRDLRLGWILFALMIGVLVLSIATRLLR